MCTYARVSHHYSENPFRASYRESRSRFSGLGRKAVSHVSGSQTARCVYGRTGANCRSAWSSVRSVWWGLDRHHLANCAKPPDRAVLAINALRKTGSRFNFGAVLLLPATRRPDRAHPRQRRRFRFRGRLGRLVQVLLGSVAHILNWKIKHRIAIAR